MEKKQKGFENAVERGKKIAYHLNALGVVLIRTDGERDGKTKRFAPTRFI